MFLRAKQTVRILAKGGILTPSYLHNILQIARVAGNKHVHFGSRQDILFNVSTDNMEPVRKSFEKAQIEHIIHRKKGQKLQNIVSSYVAADISPTVSWLSSGSYLQILDNFKFQPTLRVNIVDSVQSLVPLFFGHLNFIASPVQDYWFLYIKQSDSEKPIRWPLLILGSDIGALSQCIENNWQKLANRSIYDWFEIVQKLIEYNGRNVETELITDFKYPFEYEGFNKMYNSQNYWAGFYWRNNCYDIAFLEELCQLCFQTGISKICLTPWKSFIIKEIKERDILQWNRLLGRFGITMRHSSFDLNWHLPLNDKQALRLKQQIVKHFDRIDVCVHGLTFGIKTKPEPSFYAIKIEHKPGIKFLKRFDIFESFTISYAKNFNPNLCEFIDYAQKVPRHRVPGEIQRITKKFFAQLNTMPELPVKKSVKLDERTYMVYQCSHCLTIYDPTLGIPDKKIDSGTTFTELPENYSCSLCEAPKSDFVAIALDKLFKQSLS